MGQIAINSRPANLFSQPFFPLYYESLNFSPIRLTYNAI